MKPLLLSWSDTKGGAARAALRLHQGLRKIGVESSLLVAEKYGDDGNTLRPHSKLDQVLARLGPHIEMLSLRKYPTRVPAPFTTGSAPSRIPHLVSQLQPELVHLHWIHNGFIGLAAIGKLKSPLIWTLHDMWAFTGGCHYADGCQRFLDGCGCCPQLQSGTKQDLSHRIFMRKKNVWGELDLTIVTPSRWLAGIARTSPLLKQHRIEVIPNGLDLQRYRPHDRRVARDILGLPQDKKLLLFGAMTGGHDKRKGYHLLVEALNRSAASENCRFDLVVFGTRGNVNDHCISINTHHLGFLNDDVSIALAYSAADAFIVPSLEDNLPNTIAEAMACGTPCIAFAVGGIPEMIEHQVNGYLARAENVDDLAAGIQWLLAIDERRARLGAAARAKSEQNYGSERIALQHQELYTEVIRIKSATTA